MQNQEKINLRQARDFGELFNASTKFIKQNFKPLFQSIFFIAGPFVLIGAIANAVYQTDSFSYNSLIRNTGVLSRFFSPAHLVSMLFTIIGVLVLIGTVYEYMIVYNEKGPGEVRLGDVGRKLLKDTWKILSTFLVFFIASLMIGVFIVVIFSGMTGSMIGAGILFGFLLVIFLFLCGPNLLFLISATYIVRMKESLGVFESFGRARSLMRDNYWWTWLIMFCTYLIVFVLTMIFMIPIGIVSFILAMNSLKGADSPTLSLIFMALSTIATFFSYMLYCVMLVMVGFHYFSLVEKKEGLGLFERIEEIGKKESDNIETSY